MITILLIGLKDLKIKVSYQLRSYLFSVLIQEYMILNNHKQNSTLERWASLAPDFNWKLLLISENVYNQLEAS